MKKADKNKFQMEIEEARKKLKNAAGREAEIADAADENGGLSCDFELPYSSMPKIRRYYI